MNRRLALPVEEILATDGPSPLGRVVGRSRDGRELVGQVLGRGPLRASLIGGCHADEPVGPAMLRRLVAFLASRPDGDPLLERVTWMIVPHVNPDGEAVNAAWSAVTVPALDHRDEPDHAYDLAAYLPHVVREPPGDDMEFGFPRGPEDAGARPENRAVAAFLAEGAPFHLHGTFHGMGFASGPWFLIEPAWIERTAALREALRSRVREMGYVPFDVDRGGEKGFSRVDEGFSTRPDSRAMIAFFEARGEPETAARFRPSSMEYVRGLGGDPFTVVSEMPLFLRPPLGQEVGPRGEGDFKAWLARLAAELPPEELRAEAERHGVRGMPIRDQMRLQLALLEEAVNVVSPTPPPRADRAAR